MMLLKATNFSKVLLNNFFGIAIFCFSLTLQAETFFEGEDFERIITLRPEATKHKIEVIEFFSFSCPWCQRFDPAISDWSAYLPKDVHFESVHVTFESEQGRRLAKLFYTAKALNLTPKVNAKLFKLIHESASSLQEDTLADFFVGYGIERDAFLSSFRFSTGLNTQIMRAEKLTRQYKILSIPTIVVGGEYKVNSAMAKGDISRFLDIVQYLIKKVRQDRHQSHV